VRLVTAALLAAGLLAACSSGEGASSSGSPEATGLPVTTDGPSDLPDTEVAQPNLPTVAGQSGDTVTVTSTTIVTTTTAPTTTTTVPPPVIPSDVLFDTGSDVLKEEAGPYLAELAVQIEQRHSSASLRFVGHTDSRGSDESNLALSQRRATAVMDWFIAYGFDTSKLTAVGAGESKPIARDTRDDGSFIPEAGEQNRRVEIEIHGGR
jgi:outer membrane protein OmpA-like peptidoglycan-associated protein